MQAAELEVRPTPGGFAVFRGLNRMSRDYRYEHTATDAAERISIELNTRQRSCLCCGVKFDSSGPGNRMCAVCRSDTYRAMDRYENRPSEPDDLGRSDGRIARRQTIGYISIG